MKKMFEKKLALLLAALLLAVGGAFISCSSDDDGGENKKPGTEQTPSDDENKGDGEEEGDEEEKKEDEDEPNIPCSEKFKDAKLQATYTMTIAAAAVDNLGWYLYPQYGKWSYVVDDGNGETEVKSVVGANDWWKGTDANKTAHYVIKDGDTLTFYTWINEPGTMILEGSSTAGAATINPYDTDNGWGDSVGSWGKDDSRTEISPDDAQSIKIVITRDGDTQVAKFYTL
ncbi:MAG: hypothetical protein J1D88_08355 [Treponema sp.]|nr:hypothetical protein [Treponema sp.]